MTRSRSIGLAILGLLSALDLVGPLLTDGEHPPIEVALVGSVFGLVSLVLIGYVARGASRAVPPLIVTRVVSAVAAAPALFVDDVPAAVAALAATLMLLTFAGIALVVRPLPARTVAVR